LRGGGATIFALGYKKSTIRDLPDQPNDFIYGINLNLDNGGSITDCASGVVSACAYSLYSDRTARDVTLNLDNDVPSAKHNVRYGASYDVTSVLKDYAVTLQPANFLSSRATTVVDDTPNAGHDEWAYVQDSWKMGSLYELDYGLRIDAFQVASNEFADGFSQLSPRITTAGSSRRSR
jgi:hypothetical protein